MAVLINGQIVLQGNPFQTIESLEGKIWTKTIEKEELEVIQANHDVLSTRLFAGKIRVNVYAETKLDSGFMMVKPELEDVYFRELYINQSKPVSYV
jgi:metallophosphoesterase superfamily enzyme